MTASNFTINPEFFLKKIGLAVPSKPMAVARPATHACTQPESAVGLVLTAIIESQQAATHELWKTEAIY
jgi:hypothetical protein